MELPFQIWDVFTTERFSGNALAVVEDGSGLDDGVMSAIAREMAHSETTFIMPCSADIERDRGIRTRIFSRQGIEMPFAGHPVLGTAFAHWSRNREGREDQHRTIRLDLNAGTIPVRFRPTGDREL